MKTLLSSTFVGLMLFGFAAITPNAMAADGVTGDFHFGKVRFQPVDGLAYQQQGTDSSKPVTIVVVTDFKIDRPAFLAAIEQASALVGQIVKNEKGNFLMVSVSSPDRCGVSGFLGESSQQLGLGESFPAKNKSTASRITGECATAKPEKMFDDVYDFKLSYDLTLTAIPKPTALPDGGGEPGKALAAVVKAIQAGDFTTTRLHVREEEIPKTARKGSDLKDYFDGLKLNYPKTATVTGGLMKGDLANVEMRGTNGDDKKIKGVFSMKKVGADWRVVDQSLYRAE